MSSTAGRANRKLVTAGIAVGVLGLVSAAALWFAAGQRYDNAVSGMARAPLGCDTTLDFADAGTFILFVETTGEIAEVPGDCSTTREYDSEAVPAPSVRVTLLGPDGEEVALDRQSGTTYDTAGFVGESIRSFEVDDPGDHVLRAESASTGFAVAVGRDPNDGVGLLKLGAVAAAIGGLTMAAILLLLARRKKPSVADSMEGQFAPGQAAPGGLADGQVWVTTPPTMQPPQQPGQAQGWQAAAGPPGQTATQSGSEPSAQATQCWPTLPQTSSDHAPAGDGGSGDGSSGDGERSPWAPPTDGAQ